MALGRGLSSPAGGGLGLTPSPAGIKKESQSMAGKNKNFMMIPNGAWEKLYEKRMPGQARRVFDYIYRKTIGYPYRPNVVTSYDIARDLKIKGPETRKQIRYLIKNRFIVRNGDYKEIQEDWTIWWVGLKSPTKVVGLKRTFSRAEEEHLVGLKSPLIKDTPKRKRKESVFTNVKDERLIEDFQKEYNNITKDIGNFPE